VGGAGKTLVEGKVLEKNKVGYKQTVSLEGVDQLKRIEKVIERTRGTDLKSSGKFPNLVEKLTLIHTSWAETAEPLGEKKIRGYYVARLSISGW